MQNRSLCVHDLFNSEEAAMLALRRAHDADLAIPFRSAEEAWLWTMESLIARRDGAGLGWRPEGPPRPRILRIWGERQAAPRCDRARQKSDWRLWYQALAQLEWALRARGIVRWVVGQFEYIPRSFGMASFACYPNIRVCKPTILTLSATC
jgi:hypothetical protein